MTKSLLFCTVLLLGTTAFAHQKAIGIVKERMDGMMVLGQSMKTIAKTIKSEKPNAHAIEQAAANLKAHSGKAMFDRFPKGSTEHPSEASNTIWQNWDQFTALAMRLETLAQGLSAAASNPVSGNAPRAPTDLTIAVMTAMAPDEVFTLIGQTCAACHKDFRVKQ